MPKLQKIKRTDAQKFWMKEIANAIGCAFPNDFGSISIRYGLHYAFGVFACIHPKGDF